MMEDNYGNEYYPEESEMDGDESSQMLQQQRYMQQQQQNYNQGAMFTQQQKQGAKPTMGGYGGVSSASGVPFYGQ